MTSVGPGPIALITGTVLELMLNPIAPNLQNLDRRVRS
jgi:hypothetical protein